MDVKQKLKLVPDNPGVYIYYDSQGNVLYVGKAKNLKKRVHQYFSPNVKQEKVAAMLSHMADFRYIITPSEADALSLENNLIKEYMPPYNILLKDDKEHCYIRINVKADFPKLTFVRKLANDKAKYFGPISGSIREMSELLSTVYPTINCNFNFEKLPKNFRPCLNYFIGRCPAPCVGAVTKAEYKETIKKIIALLNGEDVEAKKILTAKMTEAAEKEQYEQALQYKNQISIINRFCARITEMTKQVDYDVFSICGNGENAIVNVMTVRQGRTVLSENHSAVDAGLDESQTLTSFLAAYCDGQTPLSKEILVNLPVDDEILEQIFTERYNRKISVTSPQKGVKKQLVNMSYENAKEKLEKSQSQLDKKYNTTIGASVQLKESLCLTAYPQRIECYDISNISGVDKVASMVVFTGGQKDSNSYRRFKIKTVEGANDFACMEEVLSRRLRRIEEKDIRFGAKPDLIVVDGGLGQLEYARRALQGSGIELVSLAKREELVYTLSGKEPIRLPRNSYALNLLINIRDEAHRFAITYFRQLHTKNGLKSVLSEIEGVGAKRQVELVRHFKNVENISNASVEQIMEVGGINEKTAKNIYDYFNK